MEGGNGDVVVLMLHQSFVREHIRYVDRGTGEEREFASARIPSGSARGRTPSPPAAVTISRSRGRW